MQIFKKTPEFDFMGKRKWALMFSATLIIISIFAIATRGLNFGLDFTGETLIEVGYPEAADLTKLRSSLERAGFKDATVQHFGTAKDVLIRIAPDAQMVQSDLADKVLSTLQDENADVEMRRQEFVGPQVGDELRDDGGLAMIIALAFILVYVMVRFEYRFALGSIAALVHDVLIVIGSFAVGVRPDCAGRNSRGDWLLVKRYYRCV